MKQLLSELPVSLNILIAILAAWFGLGIFLAYQFGWRRDLVLKWKIPSILMFLLIGPLAFPFWWLIGGYLRKRSDGGTYRDGLMAHLKGNAPTEEELDEEELGKDEEASGFVLLDSSGRSLAHMGKASTGKGDNVRLTTKIIGNAVEQAASDVLIHPVNEDEFHVRYRLNGTLATTMTLPVDEGKAVVNIIKAISGMNIAERRRPQDGSFSADAKYGNLSFRVATAGVLNGEKVSVRILDQSKSEFDITSLGLYDDDLKTIRRGLASSSGMILVCGPTGSGKSSTVHAMLRTIDSVTRNVITIEDPIEYVLPNASQIEINRKADITFANVMRSVLRQDPDVISVGEIRDPETAEIALQAAQTGHLVFATVHAGSNMASLLRLVDLGIQPQLIASAVKLVISQRLVRKLCQHCKAKEVHNESEAKELWEQNVDPSCLFKAVGCEHCYRVGYGGRTGVFDVDVMDRELKARWAAGDITVDEKSHSVGTSGNLMTTMQIRATQLAMSGITSWEDVMRLSASLE